MGELINAEELTRVKRKYMIYEKQKPKKKEKAANCPPTGGISTFTYLNFLIGVISVAANVINNVNSNNNNNNNNNNNLNVNVGNNNNNGNNMNTVMFTPMNG